MNHQEKINNLAKDLAPYHRLVSIAVSEDQTSATIYIPFLDIVEDAKPKVLSVNVPHSTQSSMDEIYSTIAKFIKMSRPLLLQFMRNVDTQLYALNAIEAIAKTNWSSAEVALLLVDRESITPTRFSAIYTTTLESFKTTYFNGAKKLDRLLVFLNQYHRHDVFWVWGKMSSEFPALEPTVPDFTKPELQSESDVDTGVEVTKPFDLSQLTIAVNKGDKTLTTIDTGKAIEYLALLHLIDEGRKLGSNVSWFIYGRCVTIAAMTKLNDVSLSLTLNNSHTIEPRQVFTTIADWLADESIIFDLLHAVVASNPESTERLSASMEDMQIEEIKFKNKIIYRKNVGDDIPF